MTELTEAEKRNECEEALRHERGRLIECRKDIELMEKIAANSNETVPELANFKVSETRMHRKILQMSDALSQMKKPNANVFEIVKENSMLWNGTISM